MQLKQQGIRDGRLKYDADGLLRADDFCGLGMLLTEVSSGYGKHDNRKVSFDHYKAMFGLLAMLRTLADRFQKATFKTFTKMKVHFLHAHGKQGYCLFVPQMIKSIRRCGSTLDHVHAGTRPVSHEQGEESQSSGRLQRQGQHSAPIYPVLFQSWGMRMMQC